MYSGVLHKKLILGKTELQKERILLHKSYPLISDVLNKNMVSP